MNHIRRNLCFLALVLSGCTTVSMAGSSAAKTKPKGPPVNVGLSGSAGGTATLPDPKLPGKYLWKMSFRSLRGASQNNGFSGSLGGVTATLYQHGVPSAVMTAPTAKGDNVSQVVVATGPGRILVRSLIERGTTLQSDKMTWHARTNKILAEGHVVYHNGKNGLTMRVPQMNADTVLKSISFGPGRAALP